VIGATRIASEVRRGERSARDTVAGALTQATAQQPRLNVNALIDEAAALDRADQIDEAVAAGKDVGPLAGVPIALKDIIDHAGRPTTCSSGFYSSIPDRSATVVQRLESAGAVIVTRTILHEFAWGFTSENPWTGPVRNPLDPSLSAGGSSGGSAAAVAGDQVPIALGTDTGGSVRVPAALCGVFGLKVTHGRVPLTGVFPLAKSLDTVGPIAGTVGDLAAAYAVIAGFDPTDPWSAPQPVVRPSLTRKDLRGLRVGIPEQWLDTAPVTDDVAEAFAGAIGRLQAMGASIVEIDDPELCAPGRTIDVFSPEVLGIHRAWRAEGRPYGADLVARFEVAEAVTEDKHLAALEWRTLLRNRTALAFAGCDVIATPTVGSPRKVIGTDTISTPSGEHHHRTVLSWFTALVNSMGCPAITGPIAESGVPPASLQVIGPWWSEHRLLEVAGVLEEQGVLARPGL
jgi:aspartyl-tRNA(Asn)/glutamyl-tRNA(Gln) amidotransferase subunit A